MGGSCFFIGHRDARDEVFPVIKEQVVECILHHDVSEFFVGHYGSFDRMAARAVMEAKAEYPDVRLYLVLPYHPAIRPVPLPEGFDGSYYPWGDERIPYRLAIVKTNRLMVKTCDILIAYAWHPASSARDLVEYAHSQGKTVINLSDQLVS